MSIDRPNRGSTVPVEVDLLIDAHQNRLTLKAGIGEVLGLQSFRARSHTRAELRSGNHNRGILSVWRSLRVDDLR